MHALKPKLLGNRCPIKHAFSNIFIGIQVGYTVQYIDTLKSYLNLNKYMAKKRGLWCIYFQILGHCIPVQGITVLSQIVLLNPWINMIVDGIFSYFPEWYNLQYFLNTPKRLLIVINRF